WPDDQKNLLVPRVCREQQPEDLLQGPDGLRVVAPDGIKEAQPLGRLGRVIVEWAADHTGVEQSWGWVKQRSRRDMQPAVGAGDKLGRWWARIGVRVLKPVGRRGTRRQEADAVQRIDDVADASGGRLEPFNNAGGGSLAGLPCLFKELVGLLPDSNLLDRFIV